jgi:hypothetical protein
MSSFGITTDFAGNTRITWDIGAFYFDSGAVLPAFTTEPIDQSAIAGETVTLMVAVTGTPTPTLQWYKDGVAIEGATSSTLALTDVTTDDSGTYTVVASNSGGSTTSDDAVLSVSSTGPTTIRVRSVWKRGLTIPVAVYAIDPLTILILLALLFAAPSGKPGQKHFWEFWKHNPVAAAQKSQADLDAERAKQAAAVAKAKADVTKENSQQLTVAHEAVIATGAAIDEATTKTAAGSLPVKELATAKTLNTTARDGLDQALGAAPPQRIRELEQMVNDLNNDRAAGRGALQAMQGALDASVKREAELAAKVATVEAQAKAAIAAKESASRTLQAKEDAWALERDAVARQWERFTFWGKLAGAVGVLVLLYTVYLLLRAGKLGSFAKDAVGMTEMLKGELQKRASAEDYAAIKETMAKDWMTVGDGTHALVAKIKKELRL